jgi:hypothetical protein
VCRADFERLIELRDFSIGLRSAQAYFQSDDTKFSDARKRRFFIDIERELQGLDAEAWAFLKNEALPRLRAKHPTRGWQQLFETLNESKGYNYLARIGCTAIKFIPRAKADKIQTPDLQGMLPTAKALCEVKTINASAIEFTRRSERAVGTTAMQLDAGFFNKLAHDITAASSQMLAFDDNAGTHRTVFIIVNFDDNLHEYAEEYQRQIDHYVADVLKPEVQVVFDIKPPFYSAVSA